MGEVIVRFRSILLLLMAVSLTGCSLIFPQPAPTIPPIDITAVPVGTPIAAINSTNNGISSFASSDVVLPDRDSDIAALMNDVSDQQLKAYLQQLEAFGTRNSFSETQRDDFGIGATRRWIFSEFERVGLGRLQVEFQNFPLLFNGLTANQQNVVATLPGVGNYPGVVVVGAHYDSRVGEGDATNATSLAPAANDNGTGVAMLLELARLLSTRTWNQTIVFVAFAAEEQGTQGSKHFVNTAIRNGLQVDLMLNNDSIGGRPGIPQSIRMFAPNIESSPSGHAARYIEYINRIYQPEHPITVQNAFDREGRYGDQREFQNALIPAVRFIESQEDPSLLNCSCDRWDRIDFQYFVKNVRVNLAAIASWAGSPPPPARPSVTPTGDAGSYLVAWTPDPAAVSYAVSFRRLDQPGYPEFRYASSAEAGQVVVNGLDPAVTYGVSIAPIGIGGRLGGFSKEQIVP